MEDAAEVIEYFGSRNRIGNVHFRNVRVVSGPMHYVEEFVNEGDCDMGECMAALVRHGCALRPPLWPSPSFVRKDQTWQLTCFC